jgi:tRNA(Ile)-lysidine synthase
MGYGVQGVAATLLAQRYQRLTGLTAAGLAAMPLVSDLGPGRLVRPLLGVPRAALEAYARDQGLSWVEDPSNVVLAFDRNFLRRRVLPLLRERWPAASATLARSAAHCAEAAALIAEAADESLRGLGGSRPGTLSLPALARLDPPRARAALRLWLKRLGLPRPDTAHLGRILAEVLPARADANPLVASLPGRPLRPEAPAAPACRDAPGLARPRPDTAPTPRDPGAGRDGGCDA